MMIETRASAPSSGAAAHRQRAALAVDPAGEAARVEDLAQLAELRRLRLYGQGVAVALLDDGVHVESLRTKLRTANIDAHGAAPVFDVEHSRVPGLPPPFSRTRKSHGSMCAYDVCLAAPGCTLLDLPVLAPRPAGGRRLDHMLAAYRRLIELLRARTFRHVVVVNAWQTLPSDEHLGLPADHADHPLYQALSDLDAAGADVLFAAPDHHAKRIHGPALHPRVLTVTAVNLDGTSFESSVERVRGDHPHKPDIANFQGFAGYELFPNQGDYGTSAATALSAGLIAAVRSAPRRRSMSPAELRELVRRSARRPELAGSSETPAARHARAAEPGIMDVAHLLRLS